MRVAMRLVLDAAALVLLLLAFAYWWLGNQWHEVFGTTLFILLGRHLLSNGPWWKSLRRGRYDARRIVSVGLTVCLALAMAVLLVTSLAISRTTFALLPLPDSFALREAHLFAAYWVMVLVGLHIGLNWTKVLMLSRRFGMTGAAWRWSGSALGGVVAVQGLRSAAIMDLWTRLRFDYSLLMWDFNTQSLEFLGHWLAILTLFAFAMHWDMRLFGRVRGFTLV